MNASRPHHVLIRSGDATAEIESIVSRLGSAEAAGLHRFFYVSRAGQTVVMVRHENSPLAVALRERPGWGEPSDAE